MGEMGSRGHRSAVAEVFGVKLSGFLAWWLWRTVYLMKLPGLDRKIRVATDRTLDLILPPDIVLLKTERPAGIRREHFEAGQIVFREGDRATSSTSSSRARLRSYLATHRRTQSLGARAERVEMPEDMKQRLHEFLLGQWGGITP